MKMRHWTNVLTIRKKLPGEALERTREINPTGDHTAISDHDSRRLNLIERLNNSH